MNVSNPESPPIRATIGYDVNGNCTSFALCGKKMGSDLYIWHRVGMRWAHRPWRGLCSVWLCAYDI